MHSSSRSILKSFLAFVAIGVGVASVSVGILWSGRPLAMSRDRAIELVVRHPTPSQRVASDSEYVMGSLRPPAAQLTVDGVRVKVSKRGGFIAYLEATSPTFEFVAALGSDTVRLRWPPNIDGTSSRRPAQPEDALATEADTAEEKLLARERGSTFAGSHRTGVRDWLLLSGTKGRLRARAGNFVQVELSPRLKVWVPAHQVFVLDTATSPQSDTIQVGLPSITEAAEIVEIVVPVNRLPAVRATALGESLLITLHGSPAVAREAGAVRAASSFLRSVHTYSKDHQVEVRINLRSPVYGYSIRGGSNSINIRLRKPPPIIPEEPLRGLKIAVDAGHPPGGAVGPTGLREADVTLGVAKEMEQALLARGARVHLTRDANTPRTLAQRLRSARRSDPHALVSVHVDAVPSGWNPFNMSGSATYAFDGAAIPLASAVQWGLLRRLGFRDRGVRRGDFGMVRDTWIPSVLTEGATMTIPEHEEVLRTRGGQRRYADGVVLGLEIYFRALHTNSRRTR